jgi:biopolymer transport protein ExbD
VKIDLREPEGDEINLTPLIDCVFLLLIFFMVTTSFHKGSQKDDALFELLLKLPVASAATQTTPFDARLVIGIDSEGDTYLEGQLVGRAQLHQRLQALASEAPNAHVRVEGDAAASHQQLVHVLDLCQFVGLWNVGVRTR